MRPNGNTPIPITVHEPGSGSFNRYLRTRVVEIAAIVTVAVGVAKVWWSAEAHAHDELIHVDAKAATAGGGLAMRNEIREVLNLLREQRAELRNLKLDCWRVGERLRCVVEVPEAPR